MIVKSYFHIGFLLLLLLLLLSLPPTYQTNPPTPSTIFTSHSNLNPSTDLRFYSHKTHSPYHTIPPKHNIIYIIPHPTSHSIPPHHIHISFQHFSIHSTTFKFHRLYMTSPSSNIKNFYARISVPNHTRVPHVAIPVFTY